MFGFKKKSKTTKNLYAWRISLSKLLGLAIGIFIAGLALEYVPEFSLYTAGGVILWFTLQGAIIGMAGIFTKHPVLKSFPLPAWFRGAMLGLGLHLVLGLLLFSQIDFDALPTVWLDYDFVDHIWFWIAFEGLLLGLLWDVLITAVTGEGKKLAKSL